ncbi:hypothetical protein GCM10009602_55960 [Nocardiopsis tropica]
MGAAVTWEDAERADLRGKVVKRVTALRVEAPPHANGAATVGRTVAAPWNRAARLVGAGGVLCAGPYLAISWRSTYCRMPPLR